MSGSFGRATLVLVVLGALGLIVGAALAIAGGIFFQSYLLAFMFWTGVSLGALVFLAVNHMAGGSWGAVVRRPLEAMVSAIPLTALFFVPLLFGIHVLYPWTDPAYLATHPTVDFKTGYLNTPFFILRAVLYFVIWTAMAWMYLRGARRQDAAASPAEAGRIGYRLRNVSGVMVVVYVMTMTFAAVDWGMSLNPFWWSGIYGVIFMISQAITAMALLILMMVMLARVDPRVDELLTWKRIQDLGNFLLGFTMFWAYVNISQLMIQWSNNVVETVVFYYYRFELEPWRSIGIYLAVVGFAIPFLILGSRWVKRNRIALSAVALLALFNQVVHIYWYLIPESGRLGMPTIAALVADVAIFVGLGAVWLAFVLWRLGAHPLVAENDPRLLAPPVPRTRDHPPVTEGAEARHA